jgi:hypothetical protein
MAAKQATNYDPEQLEALRYAVHGISAPFTCGGTFVPEQPTTIGFPDQTEIPVLRAKSTYEQVEQLRPLVKRCQPAPFGKGRKRAMTARCAKRFNSKPSRFPYCISIRRRRASSKKSAAP